ncbi:MULTISPECIES: hypothetical protein [Vibrio]|uniref:hypothetical protein n=1 Tax=Vibrio TaxID=662 RepID=UPI0008419C47|nr:MULTISPECIES: hypothetical protein [Vibrio]ODM56860.1 hypothetical protein BC455_18545 [Vibrio harveyi]USD58499.1 hypothetical protein J4N44_27790 [Vibrio sp. SCSIO 43155]
MLRPSYIERKAFKRLEGEPLIVSVSGIYHIGFRQKKDIRIEATLDSGLLIPTPYSLNEATEYFQLITGVQKYRIVDSEAINWMQRAKGISLVHRIFSKLLTRL